MKIIEIEKSEDREIIIKTSTIAQKIEWINEGFFFDILYQDTNPEVRLEVAKKAAYLPELKNDEDYRVKLEVLKKKGFDYMEFVQIENEHFSIIQEAIEQGYDCKTLETQNQRLKMFVLKNKGYKYCLENKIIENYDEENFEIKKEMVLQGHKLLKSQVKGEIGNIYLNSLQQDEKSEVIGKIDDVYILKNAILNGYVIQNIDSAKFSSLFRDREFRINCIEKGIYLKYILRSFKSDKGTLLAYIKNGQGSIILEFTHYNRDLTHYNRDLIYYVNQIIDVELIQAVQKYMPLNVEGLSFNQDIFNEISNKEEIKNTLINLNTNVLSL